MAKPVVIVVHLPRSVHLHSQSSCQSGTLTLPCTLCKSSQPKQSSIWYSCLALNTLYIFTAKALVNLVLLPCPVHSVHLHSQTSRHFETPTSLCTSSQPKQLSIWYSYLALYTLDIFTAKAVVNLVLLPCPEHSVHLHSQTSRHSNTSALPCTLCTSS